MHSRLNSAAVTAVARVCGGRSTVVTAAVWVVATVVLREVALQLAQAAVHDIISAHPRVERLPIDGKVRGGRECVCVCVEVCMCVSLSLCFSVSLSLCLSVSVSLSLTLTSPLHVPPLSFPLPPCPPR